MAIRFLSKSFFVFLFLIHQSLLFAQTGPGGIGNSSNMLFWYKADAVTGAADGSAASTIFDQSGNSVNATVRTGALEFDGINNKATSNNSLPSSVTNNFTIEAWVLPSGSHEIDIQDNSGFSGRNGQKYLIYPTAIWGASHAGMGISVGTNGISVYEHAHASYLPPLLVWEVPVSTPALLSTWTHIAVVYENKQPKLYLNGNLVATGMVSQMDYIHPSIDISGSNLDNYGYYEGSVDEIRIWNYSKTGAQINADLNRQIVEQESGLIGNWRMDEGSGNILYDGTEISGSLTLSNGTQWVSQCPNVTIGAPNYFSTTQTINGKPVFGFNGIDSRIQIPSSTTINSTGPYSSRYINFVIKTGANVTNRQVIYEEGDASRGLNTYIDNGMIYVNGWNIDLNSWGPRYVSSAIQANTDYVLTLNFDYNRGVVEGFLNGAILGNDNGVNVGQLLSHSPANIGFFEQGTRFHDNALNGSGYLFEGSIAEIIGYTSLNSAERKLVENIFASKYGITLSTNDYFSFESLFNNDLKGIGQDNAQNLYLSTVSDFLTIAATTPADGYFAMLGHDNLSSTSYLIGYVTSSDNAPKNVSRMERTWRVDATATGNLNFSIPQSALQSPNLLYQKAVLILDSDGDFKTGSRIIVLNEQGSDYTIDNLQVLDGDYVSFGILNQYEFTSYSNNVDAFGKADINYEDIALTSSGLSVKNPSSLDINDYFVFGNNAGSQAIEDNNTPDTDILRSNNIWQVNEYGDVGQVIISIDPSIYPLPSGKDRYVILISRNQNGVANTDFTNVELYGCVHEGSEYKAYYITLNNGDLITIGASTAANELIIPKQIATQSFLESNNDLTNYSTVFKNLIIKEQTKYIVSSSCVKNVNKATLNMVFNTGDNYIYGNNPFTASVEVLVNGYTVYNYSSATPVVTYTATLNIDHTAPEILQYIDVTDDYNSKGVKIYEIKVTSYSPSSITLLNQNLELDVYINEEDKITVPLTDASPVIAMDYQSTTGKVYKFLWDTDHCGAPSYQFQLLKLYNTIEPADIDEHNITASPDWSQALNMETSNKTVTLTMAEGTGYYAWRVRPIGSYYDGGAADSRNWGTWTTSSIQIPNLITLNGSVDLSAALAQYEKTILYFDQFDRDKNFIYNRVFTEDNKVHEGITYANGLMQVKQTQAKVPSNIDTDINVADGQILASQTIYDYAGRAAVNSLGAPILDNDNELGYRTGLVTTNSGLYGPENFDTDSKIYAPDPVDPVNGGWINFYYSDNNVDDISIPSAENFPFSRTVFDNEGNNRVVETSGPGNIHKVGNGHTVRMQYGSVSDYELIRIFGDEAPDASSVYKVATTDQNNITSIAYIDKSGKTIATCLAKNDLSSNLTALDSETNGEFDVKEVVNKNVPYGTNGLLATKALNLVSTTDVKITYEITPAIITSTCGDYCSTCGYQLKVKILDLNNPSNNKIIQKSIDPGTVENGANTCTATKIDVNLNTGENPPSGNELNITLPAGKYIIEKIIELDPNAAQAYATSVIEKVDADLAPIVSAINAKLDASDVPGLLSYLQSIQTQSAGSKVNVEVYSEGGDALYSLLDDVLTNNLPLADLPDGCKVKLITTCCEIEIPVILPLYNPCTDSENDGEMGNYFAQYLLDKAGLTVAAATQNKYTNAAELNTLINNMLNETYYTCDRLWDCWQLAVYSNAQFSGTANDDQTQVDNTQISGQDGYNDFPQWVKDQGTSANLLPSANIIDQFLDCAGYHYAGFVTNSSSDLLKYKPYKYFYYNYTARTIGQKMCENSFCNYAGDPAADINTDLQFSPCNEDMCDKDYISQSDNGTYYKLTVGETETSAGYALTENDYYSLNKCLKNQLTDVVPTPTNADLLAQIQAQKLKMESECRTTCDDKYQEFLTALEKVYGGTYRPAGLRTTWGPELMENGGFTKKIGGWYDGTSPVTLKVGSKLKAFYDFAGGSISTGNILNNGNLYQLKFRLYTTIDNLRVWNGATMIYESPIGGINQDITLSFNASANSIYFERTNNNEVILDNVSIKQQITYTATEVKHEDMCGTAKRMVDYCKEQCNLTVVMADCDPVGQDANDKLISLGTQEEIDVISAILNGTFIIDEKYPDASCGADFEDASPSLRSYYGFTKDAHDGSGYGLNGIITNTVLTSDRFNVDDKAYSFNGTTSYIDAAQDSRNVYNQVTVSAWISPSASATESAIISKYNTNDGKGYELLLHTNGTVELVGNDGNGYKTSGACSTNVKGSWHHVIGLVNNGNWQIWIDGIKESESLATVTTVDLNSISDNLTIGKTSSTRGGSYLYFNGKIDEVFLYNKAITPYQIGQLHTTQFTEYTQTPASCLDNPYFITYPDYPKQDVTYNKSGNQYLEDFVKVDGGYMMTGYNYPSGTDFYMVKTDDNFNKIWEKSYGGTSFEWGYAGAQVNINASNYLVMGGVSYSDISGTKNTPNYGDADSYITVLNSSDGSYYNEINLGGNGEDFILDIASISNGFVAAGTSASDQNTGNKTAQNLGGYDGLFYKVDQNFNVEWQKTYGGTGEDIIYKIHPLSDGYILLGYTESNNPSDPLDLNNGAWDGWIVRTDLDGVLQWEKRYGGSDNDIFSDIVPSNDGNFIIVGHSYSQIGPKKTAPNKGQNDLWVLKINPSGDVIWEKTFGGTDHDGNQPMRGPRQPAVSIVKTSNGYVILCTTTSNNGAGSDITEPKIYFEDGWVVKLDFNGQLLANKRIGNHFQSEMVRLIAIDDDNFVSAGKTTTNGFDFYIVPFGLTSNIVNQPQPICIKWISPANITTAVAEQLPPPLTYDQSIITIIKEKLESQLQKCNATSNAALIAEYNRQCSDRNSIKDKLEVSYKLQYHHYTLYYHDRAGHLVKTIPPLGVHPLDLSIENVQKRLVHPDHTYMTTYIYNSLGQLVNQSTPDGGESDFLYNKLGQLRFSQNQKQANPLISLPVQYSYTKYDYLGRTIEVGQANLGSSETFTGLETQLNANPFGPLSYPTVNTSEQTYTVYSDEATNVNYLGNGQRYLQNRVSYVYTNSLFGERSITYFSYDPHGNVEWLVQDIPGLSKTFTAYEYDLISNKVLKVKYNEQLPDQFFHKYEYDADNRITAVYTSKDNRLWDKDAGYLYYKHGPLKRNEIGEDKLQGLDYAYTIQGWLKGVNTSRLNAAEDPGQDGASGSTFCADEYGMTLGYFEGDFKRTGSVYNSDASAGSGLNLNSDKPLYNGNISSWVGRIEQEYRDAVTANIPNITSHDYTNGNIYTYDHLNRILQSDFKEYNGASTIGTSYSASASYQTQYSYDANGNILTLLRSGKSNDPYPLMDNLAYSYQSQNNKLRRVQDDPAADNNYTTDIDNQVDSDNYLYDGIGNLITDKQEGTVVSWTVYGKISEVKRQTPTINNKPEIRFTYDAQGNRIKKEVNSNPYDVNGNPQRVPDQITTSYYVRDASGNIMGVYERNNTSVLGQPGYYLATFKIKEQPIYGSKRVGQFSPGATVAQKTFALADQDKLSFETEFFDRAGEYKNWEASTLTTVVANDKNSQPQSFEVTNLYMLSYNDGGNNITSDNQLSFLGKTNENVSIAEDSVGNVLFYAVTAEKYWGATNTCLLYDASGALMPGSSGITANAKAQSVIVKHPGNNQEYYLINSDLDGQLKYTVIDMGLAGNGTAQAPKGDVKAGTINMILDTDGNTNYGTALQAIEDQTTTKAVVYASKHTPVSGGMGTMQLVSFIITENGAVTQVPDILATVDNIYVIGQSEIKISENGRKLLLFNHKLKKGWFDHQESEILVYNIGYDYKVVQNNLVSTTTIPVPGGTKQGVSAEFDNEDRFIYYTRDLLVKLPGTTASEKTLWKYDMRNAAITQVQVKNAGDLRRGKDGRIYVANVKDIQLPAFSEDAQGNTIAVTAKNIQVGYTLTGGLSAQNHKIIYDAILSGTVARVINLKQYEITDHLGNVAVVISDVNGSMVVSGGISMQANVLSYSNYYPFGMLMPGRSFNSSEYRYGFNGKEKDDELKGSGNSYDFDARIYDPRLGRFLSLDPLMQQFPSESNYSFAGNSPIVMVDEEGKKKTYYITIIDKGGKETRLKIIDKDAVRTKVVGHTYVGHFDGMLHPVTKDYNLKQNITIDLRKKGADQYSEEEEQEDGETSNFLVELWEERDNLIIYGNGSFPGEIEMGSKHRPKGKTSVITSDEATDILGSIQSAGGFKKGNMSPLDATRGISDNVVKIVDKAMEKKPEAEPNKEAPSTASKDSSYCSTCKEVKPKSEKQHTFEE